MPRPSERVVEILRRAAMGAIVVRTTRRSDGHIESWLAYDDGVQVLEQSGHALPLASLTGMVRNGWLLPGDDVGLFRARTLTEGAAPKRERKEDGVGKQLPTPQQTRILARISTHKLVVGFADGRKHYAYGDGVPVRRQDAERIIRQRWVVPESPGLFHGEEPQSYVCRGRP